MEVKEFNHPLTGVVAKNNQEAKIILNWAESVGIYVNPILYKFENFPVWFGIGEESASFTDKMDRLLYYMPFREFLIKKEK